MLDYKSQDMESKKRYLKRYKKNLALINRLKYKVVVLDERIYNLRSPGLSDMPRGGTPITKEDLIAEKDGILRRIKRLEDKGRKYKIEIEDVIDDLEDPRYADVLEAFLIDGKSFGEIAEENCYSVRHVERLYSDAIKTVSV